MTNFITPDEIETLLKIAEAIRERQRQAILEDYRKRFEAWLEQHPIKERA